MHAPNKLTNNANWFTPRPATSCRTAISSTSQAGITGENKSGVTLKSCSWAFIVTVSQSNFLSIGRFCQWKACNYTNRKKNYLRYFLLKSNINYLRLTDFTTYDLLWVHVGTDPDQLPVLELASPLQLKMESPVRPNPVSHSKVADESKLLLSVKAISFPLIGFVNGGQVPRKRRRMIF
jgi:hypothetical protein